MKTQHVSALLAATFRGNHLLPPARRRSPYLAGPPGCGKSDLVRQAHAAVAREWEAANPGQTYHLWDIRAAQFDAVDVRGYPSPRCATCHRAVQQCTCGDKADHRIAWLTPSHFPCAGQAGVLFLDELPQASIAVQNALLQLVRDRRVGDYRLPDGVQIVAAGNRLQDRAGASRLTTALADRFHPHVNVEVSVAGWLEWAMGAGIDSRVRGWIGFKPAALLDFDPRRADDVWATPRSYEALSDLIGITDSLPPHVQAEVYRGTIGEAQGGEFLVYLKVYAELPTIAEIVAKPKTVKIPGPEEAAPMYAMTAMVTGYVRDQSAASTDGCPKLVGALMGLITRLPREYQFLAVRDLIAVRREYVSVAEVRAWVAENRDALVDAGFGQ